MNRVARIIVMSLSLVLTLAAAHPIRLEAKTEAPKVIEYSGDEAVCETEMAHLDSYAIQVQNKPKYTAYVIVYGGRYGTARHEMRQRRSRIKRYLVKNRGIEPERVRVINGGFREKVTVELWLVEYGGKFPQPTMTISPADVKYKRTKFQFNCSSFY